MAKQTAQVSGLLKKKLGDAGRKALLNHKEDETTYGMMDLPAGIEGGVAQLVDCRFSEYENGENKGKLFFYAAGIVVEPTEFTDKDGKTTKVAGMRTSIMEPLHDTPQRQSRPTLDDHVQWVLNELRKLGAETAELEDLDNLEAVAAALKDAKPFFNFRTWVGQATPAFPNPRVNSQWIKAVEDYGVAEDSTDVVDESGEVEEPAKPAAKTPPPTKPATPAKPAAKAPPKKEPEPEPEPELSVEKLVADATEGDENAQAKLKELAMAAGSSEEDVDNAADWNAVGELISATSESEPATEDEWKPGLTDIYKYQVIDPKTKKPVVDAKTKKPKPHAEVEVIEVDEDKRTVDLKSVDNPKLSWKGVSWDALESATD